MCKTLAEGRESRHGRAWLSVPVHMKLVLHVGALGLMLLLAGTTLPLELLKVKGDPLQVESDVGMPLLLGWQLVVAIHLPHEVGPQGLAFLKALHLVHADLQVAHHLILGEGVMIEHLHCENVIRLHL